MDDLVSALKQLREAIGENQQIFATRLGLSLRALANYETGKRQPPADVLDKLIELAMFTGHGNLAKTFADIYASEMKGSGPATDLEAAWVWLLLGALRNKELIPTIWKRIGGDLMAAPLVLKEAADHGAAVKSDLAELFWALRVVTTPMADEELRNLAFARSKKTGETFEEAYSEVIFERPDLYEKCWKERKLKHEIVVDFRNYLEPGLPHSKTKPARKGKKK